MTRSGIRPRLGLVLLALLFCSGPLPAEEGCVPLPAGVLGWWPGEDTADDLTLAAHHGQLINGTIFSDGVIGRALEMDGIDDRVEVPDAPGLRPVHFTLAAWIRLDDAFEWACIICKQYGGGSADSYSLWVNNGVLQGGRFGFAEAAGAAPLPVGRALHTAVTYDGAIIRLYLDGGLIATAAGPGTPVPYDANPLMIGAEDNGVNAYTAFFDGLIDEALIFGRALSGCEIHALFQARSPGHCRGDADGDSFPDFQDNCPAVANMNQLDTDADGTGDLCDCAPMDPGLESVPAEAPNLVLPQEDLLDWCLEPVPSGVRTVYDILRGDLEELPVGIGNPECRSRCVPPLPGLVGWWGGDSTVADLAGGNDAALQNGATYAGGWTLEAFDLDGINDRVRTGNMTLDDTFSVVAWVNSEVVNQGAYKRIVETSFSSQFALTTGNTGTGYKFIVRSPSAPYGAANGGSISPGEWQLIAGTYDGSTGTLYVDGTSVASDIFTSPGTVDLPVNIGAYLGGGFSWNGRIDEVQIYDRALSASEVRQLFEAGSAGQCKMLLGGTDAEWTSPWVFDAEEPALHHGFWYLYRGRNTCGTGAWGFASSGAERISTVCD